MTRKFWLAQIRAPRPSRPHYCEQAWEGGRNPRNLSQNGYGVPEFSERISEKYSWNLSLRNILRNIAESQISNRNREYSAEEHEFRNNSEFSEHRSSFSEISLRKSSFRCASLLPRSFSERKEKNGYHERPAAALQQ